MRKTVQNTDYKGGLRQGMLLEIGGFREIGGFLEVGALWESVETKILSIVSIDWVCDQMGISHKD